MDDTETLGEGTWKWKHCCNLPDEFRELRSYFVLRVHTVLHYIIVSTLTAAAPGHHLTSFLPCEPCRALPSPRDTLHMAAQMRRNGAILPSRRSGSAA